MMNELIFKLTELEYLKIVSKSKLAFDEIDFCCGDVIGYFINIKQNLCVGNDSAGLFFESFINGLKKVIDNKLQLHESLIRNLGFMYNQYYHQSSRDTSEFVKILTPDCSNRYWIGLNYEIWETSGDANPNANTWLYNDDDGSIIIEVTEFYKWSMQEDEPEDPDFITYEEFMKNYKPLIHRIIPREIAISWLEQAMKVYRDFYSTEKDYQRAIKELNW